MDPNANLEEMLSLARAQLEYGFADADRLAELVLAMDEWMSKGGFPPKKWEKGR